MDNQVIQGDCLNVLGSIPNASADLVYLDPPFFTCRNHAQRTRDGMRQYQFPDKWKSKESYESFLKDRIILIHRILKSTGSVFFHCNRNSTHIARQVLEEIFGSRNFRAEIIWSYRRWTNGQKNLIPAHQTILFFTKANCYKFNNTFGEYSPATNLDQIWQRRVRDSRNKSVYARDERGNVVSNGSKKGVPLSDVWDIPYLNPKAKERVGYPTQKPILLLEKIISLVTSPNDLVVDPFCGSGTTLVAARLLGRQYIGIDEYAGAIALTKERLDKPIRSRSEVLERGREAYENKDAFIDTSLNGLDILRVQRNRGIDAFLKLDKGQRLIPIRVQRPNECLQDTIDAIYRATEKKQCRPLLVVQTHEDISLGFGCNIPEGVVVIPSLNRSVRNSIAAWEQSCKKILKLHG